MHYLTFVATHTQVLMEYTPKTRGNGWKIGEMAEKHLLFIWAPSSLLVVCQCAGNTTWKLQKWSYSDHRLICCLMGRSVKEFMLNSCIHFRLIQSVSLWVSQFVSESMSDWVRYWVSESVSESVEIICNITCSVNFLMCCRHFPVLISYLVLPNMK